MTSWALLTPSFSRDFARCELLVESCERYLAPSVKHYIIIDQRDEAMFAPLRSRRTELVLKQDVLPSFLHQVPFRPKWWWQWTGRPVRGWMVQQIVKLSADRFASEDAYIFADSDTFFVKSWDPDSWIRHGAVPMFRESGPPLRGPMTTSWFEVTGSLLGVSFPEPYETNYVTSLAVWRRDNLRKLHRALEERHGTPWQKALCPLRTVSEYTLYGLFCDGVLGEAAEQYHTDIVPTLNYWPDVALDQPGVERWAGGLEEQHVMGMVSSRSLTPVDAIRQVFDLL